MDAVVKLFKAQAEQEERERKARDSTRGEAGEAKAGLPAMEGAKGEGAKAGGKSRKAHHALPDGTDRPTRVEAEAAVRTLLAYLGENPAREGLLDTPQRVVKAYDELFAGYGEDAEEFLGRTFGEIGTFDDMVLLRDIPFFSHCEHHMVPFYGKAHVAYFPVERVVGLSKIARVVDIFAKRLQTQEHLTSQIVTTLDEGLRPRGVAVMIEAEHMCMSMRGITKPGVTTLTSQFTGAFRDDPAEQVRFMTMVRARG